MTPQAKIKQPYPWLGGKSRIAALAWDRFGTVRNYVEPFFGGGAVLLNRPGGPDFGVETINDKDRFVANFWRATQADPEAVARWCDWPVNEADLHARHLWLVNQTAAFRERMETDPDYYDAKIAGWWVWGLCAWIGSGWCRSDRANRRSRNQIPHLSSAGKGVHRPSNQIPHLGSAGSGVHRPSNKLPHLGDAGRGVHRPSNKLPHLGDAGRGESLADYFGRLRDRTRSVRVACGDWTRVTGRSVTTSHGVTAVFLDPPYQASDRDAEIYAHDDADAADNVRAWCMDRGDDPKLRIALCGYEGEHEALESAGWSVVAWKAMGGYGSQAEGRGRANATRERIWFSPHCLDAALDENSLYPGEVTPT